MYGAEAAGGQFGADWNGGHTFSQSAVDFSMQEYIEPEVAHKNPQLSAEEIRFEATRILALRLVQDQSFDRKETLREEDMVTKWEVAEIDGKKQLVTRYGDRNVSLEELWRHTEEFALRVGKPEAFNRAEMHMQLVMQDALIARRATSVAFTLSHPDSVRYIQHWKQGVDGEFYSTQIDIGKHAGRDLRHDEVKGFLDRFRDHHRDTAIEVEGAVAGSYVAVRGSLDVEAVTRTAQSYTAMIDGRGSFTRRSSLPEYAPQSALDAPDRAYPLWVITDRRWFGEYKREEPPILDRIRDKEKKDIPQQTKVNYKQEKLSFTPTMPVRHEGSSDGKIIRKEYDVRHTARNSLHIVTETGVAFHAVPAILARLAEKLPAPVQAVEKSIRRHAKKESKRKKKEASVRGLATTLLSRDEAQIGVVISNKDDIASWKDLPAGRQAPRNDIPFLSPERVEPLRKGKERRKRKKRTNLNREMYVGNRRHATGEAIRRKEQGRRVKRRKEKGIKKVAALPRRQAGASEMIPSDLKKLEVAREKRWLRRVVRRAEQMVEAKPLSKKEKKLWVAVAVAAQKFVGELTQVRKEVPTKTHQRIERKRKKERVASAGVVFGWMVWILLTRKDAPVQKNIANLLPVERKLATILHRSTHEEPRWMLWSIIHYLAAIREQGMRNYPMKKKRRTLPKQGVIFTFAS